MVLKISAYYLVDHIEVENLPTLPNIPTEAVELENLPMFENHHGYINVVSSGVLCPYVIFTSNFNAVKTELKKHKRIALHGPKGCVKSLLSIVMYVIYGGNELPVRYSKII